LWEEIAAALPPRAILISSPTHLLRLSGLSPLNPAARPLAVFTAGAPLPYAAVRETQDILGTMPTEIYGSTETGALATRQRQSADDPWQPLPGIRITAHEGRLSVLSPSVDADRWLTTEDLIDLRADGSFDLLGRIDRVVKVEGKRVSLTEVEELLRGSKLVTDAAAVELAGSPSVLAVAVVPSPQGRTELAERGSFRFSRLLRREILRKLEAPALPRRWRFVDAIPSAAMGKRPPALIAALFREPNDG
jgi:acyl-coenzyme A synthetase/AMP-(fatty) acid ligase